MYRKCGKRRGPMEMKGGNKGGRWGRGLSEEKRVKNGVT